MKTKVNIFFVIMLVLTASCTKSVYLNVLKPAPITISKEINTIAVVNRYKPRKGTGWQNVLEGAFTGEQLWMDRDGALSAVNGVSQGLLQSPRFTVKSVSFELEGTGTGNFPPPLSSDEITKLCNELNVDALLLLESFDSDKFSTVKQRERNQNTKSKNESNTNSNSTKNVYYEANQTINVSVGWRLYNKNTLTISDEVTLRSGLSWNKEGKTEREALSFLPVEREAIKDVGYDAGLRYASRISPTWITVTRSYYGKGSENIKQGFLRAQNNDWEGAIQFWKNEVETSNDFKIKGKAAFNMAVASEVKGELDMALMWAKKSGYDFKNKKGINYIRQIQQRIDEIKMLNEQMENVNENE